MTAVQDRTSHRLWSMVLFAAGVLGASGIIIGAFGGHGLGDYLQATGWDSTTISRRHEQFEISVRYHLVATVALLVLATFIRANIHEGTPFRRLAWSALLMGVGTLLFSGSLYVLVLTGKTWLGGITPLGGLSWIIAWILIAGEGFARYQQSSGNRTS